ncbi:hypothetical protein MAGR_04460 [Mycolicibacterium agri]|uniref:Uncharacterized protein n=1 Tax=Mycolicibacterium agri TaxID=36811 RepID=A0A7I9VUA4_MYCAG|nr:hypothetical protein MAGR_04460 [Mycolicibacterium agri]
MIVAAASRASSTLAEAGERTFELKDAGEPLQRGPQCRGAGNGFGDTDDQIERDGFGVGGRGFNGGCHAVRLTR